MKEEIPKKEKKEKVTKEKHPGRIESGKRLAERNRLKKLEAKNKEHKEKIITQEEEPKEEYNQNKIIEKQKEVNIYKTSDIALLILVGVGVGGFYFGNKLIQKWKTNKNETKTKEIKTYVDEKPDPFYME